MPGGGLEERSGQVHAELEGLSSVETGRWKLVSKNALRRLELCELWSLDVIFQGVPGKR